MGRAISEELAQQLDSEAFLKASHECRRKAAFSESVEERDRWIRMAESFLEFSEELEAEDNTSATQERADELGSVERLRPR